MTATSSAPAPVLYVIVCGAPDARHVYDIVAKAQADGWRVCVVPTPMGSRFVDAHRLQKLTGYPVRTDYKRPEEPDVLPSADAFVVAPATFNTVNKLAHGITDTLALGLVCEGLGYGHPVIVVPCFNRGLASNGAYGRSIKLLQEDGARIVLTRRTKPGGTLDDDPSEPFPLQALMAELAQVRAGAAPVRELGAAEGSLTPAGGVPGGAA